MEAAHDFLWRVHQQAPAKGMMTIFNRSHYEDVLVTRVHKLITKDTWEARYGQINNFEKLLADNNTIILKFFLHISKKEQEERLLAREQDEEKAWKLSPGDWEERQFWESYTSRLRRRPGRDRDQERPLVHRPRQPQMVPQPRHRRGHRRNPAPLQKRVGRNAEETRRGAQSRTAADARRRRNRAVTPRRTPRTPPRRIDGR